MNIPEALRSLCPDSQWVVRDDEIEWLDEVRPQPTDAEIQEAITRLKAEYASLEYARKRKEEYDKLNQFELIGEDSINGTTNHKDAILAIKARYPKPSSGITKED